VGVAADREDVVVCPGETVILSARCAAGYVTPYAEGLVIKSMATGPEYKSTRDLIKVSLYAPLQ
jgi:hypothetical protein